MLSVAMLIVFIVNDNGYYSSDMVNHYIYMIVGSTYITYNPYEVFTV